MIFSRAIHRFFILLWLFGLCFDESMVWAQDKGKKSKEEIFHVKEISDHQINAFQPSLEGESPYSYYQRILGSVTLLDSIYTGTFEGIYNGQLLRRGKIEEGRRVGIWQHYFSDKKPAITIPYHDGKIDGVVIYYYPKQENKAAEIPYLNDLRQGKGTAYYPSGERSFEVDFDQGKMKSRRFYHRSGALICAQFYLEDGKTKYVQYYPNGQMLQSFVFQGDTALLELSETYLPDGTIHAQASVKNGSGTGIIYHYPKDLKLPEFALISATWINGKKEGSFETYYSNGQMFVKGAFSQDTISSIDAYFDFKGVAKEKKLRSQSLQKAPVPSEQGWLFKEMEAEFADLHELFPGGQTALIEFIKKNVRYPALARENDIEGVVYVKFHIDVLGNVVKVRTVKSSGHQILDEAAIQTILRMPPWNPLLLIGLPQETEFVMPVRFRLT